MRIGRIASDIRSIIRKTHIEIKPISLDWVHNVFGGLINHRGTEDTETHRDDEKKRCFV